MRLKREIRVFPALAHTVTKNYKGYDADAGAGESVAGVAAFCKEERRDDCKTADTEDTVSPLGRECGPVCPRSEDLEDLEDGVSDGNEREIS